MNESPPWEPAALHHDDTTGGTRLASCLGTARIPDLGPAPAVLRDGETRQRPNGPWRPWRTGACRLLKTKSEAQGASQNNVHDTKSNTKFPTAAPGRSAKPSRRPRRERPAGTKPSASRRWNAHAESTRAHIRPEAPSHSDIRIDQTARSTREKIVAGGDGRGFRHGRIRRCWRLRG